MENGRILLGRSAEKLRATRNVQEFYLGIAKGETQSDGATNQATTKKRRKVAVMSFLN